MPDIDDINETIAQTAADGIASATVAGQTTTVLSIDEQITAAGHVAGESAKSTPKRGLMFTKLVPPGCG